MLVDVIHLLYGFAVVMGGPVFLIIMLFENERRKKREKAKEVG